jgi:hypothetical protein
MHIDQVLIYYQQVGSSFCLNVTNFYIVRRITLYPDLSVTFNFKLFIYIDYHYIFYGYIR